MPVQPHRPTLFGTDAIVAGRYRILDELGHGGMSVVYRVFDQLESREVALKVMRLSDDDPRNALYLQQEFRSMSKLRHPKLVEVYDYGIIEAQVPYFTMELLPGEDLSSIGRLSYETIYHVLISLADVLGFMHARGYVHRDIKPANVRLLPTPSGERLDLRLMDCGLTEKLGALGGSVAGTLSYLAPEAWLGACTDIRGDLYSLGVLAYEITTGQLPFDASTGVRLLKSKTERPKDLRLLRPDVPQAFARLVSDMLAPEPANRPASAFEVLARLSEFAEVDFSPDPGAYLRTPALIGRGEELRRIREALVKASDGKPVCMTLVGPAGAGKTRLLDEALLEARLRGAWVVRSTGRGFSGGTHHVFHELAAQLLGLPPASDVLEKTGGRRWLQSNTRSTSPTDLGKDADPVAVRRARQDAMASFLEGLSHHRFLVLAIDDIHWADAASLDLLAGVLDSELFGNVAVLATLRSGEAISTSLEYFLSHCQQLLVDRLSRGQIGELITGAFGPVQPSPALLDDLERMTDGNVYFVLEILRDLAARGLVERRRTFVQLPANLQSIEVPESLTEALMRRIESLSTGARALARICAVVGRDVDYGLGRALLGLDDESFLDAVDELRRGELIDTGEPCLRLHHPRLRDALLSGISDETRRVLHLRVATEIESEVRRDSRGIDAELGHHYETAGEYRKALYCYARAGDERYDGFAYADAKDVYQRAHALLASAEPRDRSELECKLNDRLGRICFYHDHQNGPLYLAQASRNHLSYGLLWTIAPLSRVFGASLAVGFAVAATIVGNVLRFRPKPVRRTLEHLLDSFAATTYLANCYSYSGLFRRAIEASDALLPLVYSNTKLPRAGYLLCRAIALVFMNQFDEAASSCEEVIRILEVDKKTPISPQDRIHAFGGALVTRLWVDLYRGHVLHSDYAEPFEAFAKRHPSALVESWLLEVRVFMAYRRANLTETRLAWSRLVKTSAQAEVQFVENKARVWLGLACLDHGHISEAQDIADEVLAIAVGKRNPILRGLGFLLRGLSLRAWEQLSEADSCFEQAALELSREDVQSIEFYHTVRLCQASLALDLGDPGRARRHVDEVRVTNATQRLTHDLHRLRIARLMGRLALADGRPTDGLRDLEQARSIAEQLGDPLELAYCHHCIGQALRETEPDASQTQASRCEEILLELGNTYQLRRLGYRGPEEPVSLTDRSLLQQVRNLVRDDTWSGSKPPTSSRKVPVPERPAFARHDETLPAMDSEVEALDLRLSPPKSP